MIHFPLYKSFQIGRCQRLDDTRPFTESGPENPIGILEHPVFQADNDELGALEPSLYQPTNILSVRQIQRCIDFVEDVHWRRFKLQESHYEG